MIQLVHGFFLNIKVFTPDAPVAFSRILTPNSGGSGCCVGAESCVVAQCRAVDGADIDEERNRDVVFSILSRVAQHSINYAFTRASALGPHNS